MTGSVVQLNVSRGGVPKRPIDEARITPLAVDGDSYAHPEFHGGPKQAVLVISVEGIDELIALGFPLYKGALGENITTRGLDRREWRAGQQWRVGAEVILEFTKMRVPCKTLDVYGPGIQKAVYDARVKAGNPSSPKWGLSGFYASVIQPGVVRPGDEFSLLNPALD